MLCALKHLFLNMRCTKPTTTVPKSPCNYSLLSNRCRLAIFSDWNFFPKMSQDRIMYNIHLRCLMNPMRILRVRNARNFACVVSILRACWVFFACVVSILRACWVFFACVVSIFRVPVMRILNFFVCVVSILRVCCDYSSCVLWLFFACVVTILRVCCES